MPEKLDLLFLVIMLFGLLSILVIWLHREVNRMKRQLDQLGTDFSLFHKHYFADERLTDTREQLYKLKEFLRTWAKHN